VNDPPGVLPSQPADENGPVFAEPWQAQAFAMTLALHQGGLFTWSEWAQALANQIRRAQAAGDADLGDTYYHHWLAALETLVAEKRATSNAELTRYQRAWMQAAERTPHGKPIELEAGDFGGSAITHATPPAPSKY
jgi:nitrile hydratase accessory protein